LQQERGLPMTQMVASWQSLTLRSSVRFRAALRRTTEAPPRRWSRRGRIPEHVKSPKLTKVPLCLRRKASPFRIILLLISGLLEHP
jgi:hypothetical protein